MTTPAPRWVLCRQRRPDAAVRLYVFPHSGAGPGEYLRWSEGLPEVEVRGVQAPGRGSRAGEPPHTRMPELVAAIIAGIDFGTPFAFFGHSLGALVAYETARALRDQGRATPELLVVSALDPPHRQPPPSSGADAGRPPAPGEITDPELRERAGACLRADLELLDTYRFTPAVPLPTPIVVLGGAGDEHTEDLTGWSGYGRGPVDVHLLPGGHFYHRSHHDDVHALLRHLLARRHHLPPRHQ